MKIGILQCDDVQEQLQPEHANYPEMFQELFLKEDPSCSFATYRVLDGVLPQSTEECDVWLITGSRYSAYDQLEWIPALLNFVRLLNREKRKLVGICFGHQIIAEALGGKVTLSEKGWGVGMSFNPVVKQKSWMQPSSNHLNLLVSHQDQITTLPENAEILAASDFCPHYMVQYGDHFLSIQGHPEFTSNYSKDLMLSRQGRIPDESIKKGLESLSSSPDLQLSSQWLLNFMRN
ncbi:GMP synthase [Parendozoicomonas sp. Alg238-R29]|uniref:glutamine amidotransferase-related protein n=1 Tax=Parendozoicomonas sp. Alg238-R29 TaxID=2993446 RepID=UPI00248D5173|nr:GMP synthase [Parendozoicomonas sp. Alg238-R29]